LRNVDFESLKFIDVKDKDVSNNNPVTAKANKSPISAIVSAAAASLCPTEVLSISASNAGQTCCQFMSLRDCWGFRELLP
jgi:hypothetical protein